MLFSISLHFLHQLKYYMHFLSFNNKKKLSIKLEFIKKKKKKKLKLMNFFLTVSC
jgi:hypothetical protein